MSAHRPSEALSGPQELHILSSFQYAEKLLSEVESILACSRSKSPFPKYRPDLSPLQAKVIEDYLARIRAQMVRALAAVGIEPPEPQFGALHSIQVTLSLADIAFEECRPRRMRGYGELPPALAEQLNGAVHELQNLLNRLDAYLAQRSGADLAGRLASLEVAGDLRVLNILERVICERGLVEFRPALSAIVERLESRSFEIAVFGRVSAGKSSLLNSMLGRPVLPVGARPITAVPTRLVWGARECVRVWVAGSDPEEHPLEQLQEFVSEAFNPGNVKNVTRIVVELSSARLAQGIVFVDTPGWGSLAVAGAAETRAYLPHCDMGVVLLDAGSAVTPEDVATVAALYESGAPACVLLSKADLLEPEERRSVQDYIAAQMRSALGFELPVYPVSVKPDHHALLEAWFEREIAPVGRRCAELSELSLRRKTAALQQAVAAALEARLRHAQHTSETQAAPWLELEEALRRVTGRFSEARAHCLRQTDEMRHAGAHIAPRLAQMLLEGWVAAPEGGRSAGEALLAALQQIALQLSDALVRRLADAAGEAALVLRRTAQQVQLGDYVPEAEEFSQLLTEVPRLDPGQLDFRFRPNRWKLRWLPAWERRCIERALRRQAGPRLAAAFAGFGKVLEAWVRRKSAELESRFESYAAPYRAQLGRLAGTVSSSAQEQEELERDLAKLAGYARLPQG